MPKWWQPSNEKEFRKTPWINQKAIDFLESILKPEFRVCEFGGGGSTIWLSERVSHVETYEPKEEWYKALTDLELPKVKVIQESQPPYEFFDLFFIDGEPVTERAKWLMRAKDFSRCWIVLDNANRPEYAVERAYLQIQSAEYITFDGNEAGTRYLVTEFYRMK